MADVEAQIPPSAQIPLTAAQVEEWRGRIKAAKDKREKIARQNGWKDRVQAYLGKSLTATPVRDTIVVPKDYANVEQKKAQLFSQLPQIHLAPSRDEFAQAAPTAQAVLQEYLGPRHVQAEAVMEEVLFDLLCPAGLMCSKLGYESVQDGEDLVPGPPVPDPVTGALAPGPAIPAPRIVWERYFWERIPPDRVLIPADFHGSVYDRAAWLGFEFELEEKRIEGGAPGSPKNDDQQGLNVLERPDASDRPLTPTVRGVELWYRASLFDDTVKNPDQLRYLCLLDGQDVPKRHENSPYQVVQPDGTITGMIRNPIRIASLRYVSDSAYPPSDCAISAPQVEELSKGRTQMIQQRERNLSMRWVDRNRVDKDDIDKITRGEIQSIIPLDGNGNEVIGEVARAVFPRENFEFDDVVNRDLSEQWALGANQRGGQTDTTRTATELSLIQNNVDVRLRRERAKVLAYYTEAAEDLLALIQLFADEQDYVRIVGADGVGRLQAWNKDTIAGDFVFTAIPDSSVYQDQAARRQQATQVYQFLAANPQMNQTEVAAYFLREHDLEPAKFIAQPKPPAPKEPSVSFAFKGEDLSPLAPQSPIVLEIMVQAGITISPQAVMTSKSIAATIPPPEMPATGGGMDHQHVQTGTAPMQSPLNKHVAELTGRNEAGLAPGVQ